MGDGHARRGHITHPSAESSTPDFPLFSVAELCAGRGALTTHCAVMLESSHATRPRDYRSFLSGDALAHAVARCRPRPYRARGGRRGDREERPAPGETTWRTARP